MPQETVQKVLKVSLIEGADRLELLQILGWQVVAAKGEFRQNDICVYVEIDSILPECSEFEFMRPRGFRVKTIKLRGQLSQGIAFPLHILPVNSLEITSYDQIGTDVSEILGVTHYEKPLPKGEGFLQGYTRCNWPAYLPKTDEVRIQSVPGVLEELKDVWVYSSVKVDGTSATFSILDGDIHVCSRNWSKKLDNKESVYVQVYDKYDIGTKLQNIGKNIAFQGEICGPGIQKNRLGLKELQVFMFNIYLIDEHRYCDFIEFVTICKNNNLPMVPLLDVFRLEQTQDELLEMAKGKYEGTKNNREGIVIRTTLERYSAAIKGRASFKAVNNDYLLKEE